MLTRRDMLRLAGASLAWAPPAPTPSSASSARAAAPAPAERRLTHVGATPAGYAIRGRLPSFDSVDHTHALGLGVVQIRLTESTVAAGEALRARLDQREMRAVLGVTLPREPGEVEAFERAVRAAKAAGAVCLHAAMTDRRYEEFDTLAAFQAAFARHRASVTLAEPVLRRHRIAVAIENHKGWRAAEQAAWLTAVGSEYVGVCFDFGNNLALCEDPLDSLQLLAPLTRYCHLKDMGVEAFDDGFLLSEVPLGEGVLDLPAMIAALRARDAGMIFGLEMITRDPLPIPVFADRYWITFADPASPLPGRDLARTLTLVRTHPPARPLPRVTGLDQAGRIALEDDCIARSLRCARGRLSL